MHADIIKRERKKDPINRDLTLSLECRVDGCKIAPAARRCSCVADYCTIIFRDPSRQAILPRIQTDSKLPILANVQGAWFHFL
jgi:hypothetical protein